MRCTLPPTRPTPEVTMTRISARLGLGRAGGDVRASGPGRGRGGDRLGHHRAECSGQPHRRARRPAGSRQLEPDPPRGPPAGWVERDRWVQSDREGRLLAPSDAPDYATQNCRVEVFGRGVLSDPVPANTPSVEINGRPGFVVA